ncbi:unnamed protein product [Agarophyton chilense]
MTQSTRVPRSRVIHLGSDSSRCGYCRQSDGSHNYAVWALRLHVDDYQQLLDAGWRRSGCYLYRPRLSHTCCPPYVIRLDANNFKPSSTHKRVLKRLRHASMSPATDRSYLEKSPDKEPRQHTTMSTSKPFDQQSKVARVAIIEAVHALSVENDLNLSLSVKHVQEAVSKLKLFPPRQKGKKIGGGSHRTQQSGQRSVPVQNNALPNVVGNIALVLAALERRSFANTTSPCAQQGTVKRKCDDPLKRQMCIADALQRILGENQPFCRVATVGVTYPGFLNFWWKEPDKASHPNESAQKIANPQGRSADAFFLVRQVQSLPSKTGHSWKPRRSSCLGNIYVSDVSDVVSDADQSQIAKHLGVPVNSSSSEAKRPAPQRGGQVSNANNFSMQMVPSMFSNESYDLFRRYQMSIHREKASQCTKDIYTRFLVDSPLIRTHSVSSPEETYGSYHVLYRIAGTLFAVGVVDVLPKCLSSVYLFYDPDYAKLSPGTLSALKEIEWIRSVSHIYPSLRYYYMGYYIHSCPKMRYKASFYPSELLCEVSKNWVSVSEARRVLDVVGERASRLAPPEMPPAPAASFFQFDEEELRRLADDAILHAGNADDEIMQVLSFKSLRESIGSRCPDQIDMIRRSIEAFLRHVGKQNSKYYIHML